MWVETTPAEIRNLIALLIYQGLVWVSSFKRYWSTKSLYHGLWARTVMSRNRYSDLMSMTHIVDPAKEDKINKLRKVSEFLDLIKEKYKSLYLQSLFRPIIVNFSFIVISCTFLYLKFDAACSDYLIIWQNFWKFYFLFPVFFQVFLHVLFIHQ